MEIEFGFWENDRKELLQKTPMKIRMQKTTTKINYRIVKNFPYFEINVTILNLEASLDLFGNLRNKIICSEQMPSIQRNYGHPMDESG